MGKTMPVLANTLTGLLCLTSGCSEELKQAVVDRVEAERDAKIAQIDSTIDKAKDVIQQKTVLLADSSQEEE